MDYDDKERDRLFEGIFEGVIGLANLPKKLYTQTAKKLKKGLYKGYGGTLLDFDFDSPDHKLLKELRENVYLFSGAKTATQVQEMKDLLTKGMEFREFKEEALKVFKTYNESYLESEWITAHTSGSSAKNWNFTQSNKELFPRLKSVAILDQNTAEMCRRMDGVVAAVNDPIWNHNIAPRHFRCRCHEERLDKYDDDQSTDKARVKEIMTLNDEEMDPVFKLNPGKDRVIFSAKHPYFEIGRKFKQLGNRNFYLPIPDKDER